MMLAVLLEYIRKNTRVASVELQRRKLVQLLKKSKSHFYTRVLKQTGKLKAVMLTMGHKDVKTAMWYQHPEVEVVRQALNQPGGSATTGT